MVGAPSSLRVFCWISTWLCLASPAHAQEGWATLFNATRRPLELQIQPLDSASASTLVAEPYSRLNFRNSKRYTVRIAGRDAAFDIDASKPNTPTLNDWVARFYYCMDAEGGPSVARGVPPYLIKRVAREYDAAVEPYGLNESVENEQPSMWSRSANALRADAFTGSLTKYLDAPCTLSIHGADPQVQTSTGDLPPIATITVLEPLKAVDLGTGGQQVWMAEGDAKLIAADLRDAVVQMSAACLKIAPRRVAFVVEPRVKSYTVAGLLTSGVNLNPVFVAENKLKFPLVRQKLHDILLDSTLNTDREEAKPTAVKLWTAWNTQKVTGPSSFKGQHVRWRIMLAAEAQELSLSISSTINLQAKYRSQSMNQYRDIPSVAGFRLALGQGSGTIKKADWEADGDVNEVQKRLERHVIDAFATIQTPPHDQQLVP